MSERCVWVVEMLNLSGWTQFFFTTRKEARRTLRAWRGGDRHGRRRTYRLAKYVRAKEGE